MRHFTDTKSQIESIAEDNPNDLLLNGSDGFYHLDVGEIGFAFDDILEDEDAECFDEDERAECFEDERTACFETIMQLLRVHIADSAGVERLVKLHSATSETWREFFFHANNSQEAFQAAECRDGDILLAVTGNITYIDEVTIEDKCFAVIALTESTEQAMSKPGDAVVSLWSEQLDIFENCEIGDEIIAIGLWDNHTDPDGRRHMCMTLVTPDQFRRVVRPDNHHLELEYLYGNDEPQRDRNRDYGLEM